MEMRFEKNNCNLFSKELLFWGGYSEALKLGIFVKFVFLGGVF